MDLNSPDKDSAHSFNSQASSRREIDWDQLKDVSRSIKKDLDVDDQEVEDDSMEIKPQDYSRKLSDQ